MFEKLWSSVLPGRGEVEKKPLAGNEQFSYVSYGRFFVWRYEDVLFCRCSLLAFDELLNVTIPCPARESLFSLVTPASIPHFNPNPLTILAYKVHAMTIRVAVFIVQTRD